MMNIFKKELSITLLLHSSWIMPRGIKELIVTKTLEYLNSFQSNSKSSSLPSRYRLLISWFFFNRSKYL